MRTIREDYERSGRNGHFGGMGMYERQQRDLESMPQRGGPDEDPRYGDVLRGYGRGRDTVRHASLVKVIEVLAESEHSWEDAANNALLEAQRSIRNIKSIYVKDMQAVVRDGRIRSWRLNAKISFAVEGDNDHGGRFAPYGS